MKMKTRNLTWLALIAIMALTLSAALTGCGGGESPDNGGESQQVEAPADDAAPASDGVLDDGAEGSGPDSAPNAPANNSDGSQSDNPAEPAGEPVAAAAQTGGIPRLVDLGSKQCIPCQMMAPILDELTEEYAGRMEVVFIDVWLPENQALAEAYGISSIPTQIFYDGAGRELGRHVGFMSKEDILNMWSQLGIDFS